jgi:hypothetical protein
LGEAQRQITSGGVIGTGVAIHRNYRAFAVMPALGAGIHVFFVCRLPR